MRRILALHYRSIFVATKYIIKQPLEHLFNLLVIGAIISLFCITLIINKNSNIWQEKNISYPKIMVYLKQNANVNDITLLENLINKNNIKFVKNYQFISKNQALEDLKLDKDLKEISSDVFNAEQNPLPDILVINTRGANKELLNHLSTKISTFPMVNNVQVDLNYANKIDNLISFIKKITNFIEIIFIIILLLVIYNMVRLQMLIKKDAIIVSRLIGASNSFIIRPLSYYAVVQIALGLLMAFLFITWFIKYLNSLFNNYIDLFGNSFLLTNIAYINYLQIFFLLAIFTIFAVFLAVRWVFKYNYIN